MLEQPRTDAARLGRCGRTVLAAIACLVLLGCQAGDTAYGPPTSATPPVVRFAEPLLTAGDNALLTRVGFRLADLDGDPVTVGVEYSTDGGTVWLPATVAASTAGTVAPNSVTGLSAPSYTEPLDPDLVPADPGYVPWGMVHELQWDTAADLGTGTTLNVSLRLVASDAASPPDESSTLSTVTLTGITVDNSGAVPAIIVVAPPATASDPASGLVEIFFDLNAAGPHDVTISYDSGGGTFIPATILSDGLTGLAEGPYLVSWDSVADLPGATADVVIEVANGTGSGQSAQFTVDNTTP